MPNETILAVTLTDNERDRMRPHFTHVAYPDAESASHDDLEHFLSNSMAITWKALPRRVREKLLAWKSTPATTRAGCVVIDNLPVDSPLPPTPFDGRRSPDKHTSISEVTMSGIGRWLGEPFSFDAERGGQIVQDLTAVKGKETALTNEGAVMLGWHTEHAGTTMALGPHARIVDYLVFFGLRADPETRAKTLVADVRDALALMDEHEIEALRQPLFLLRPPFLVRHALGYGDTALGPVPVLSGPMESMQVRVALYGDLTEATTTAAAQALDSLRHSLTAVQRRLTTKPGRLSILDNRVVLHARAPYSPRFDGSDRWLQRLMVTESLYALRCWQRHSHHILTVE